MLHLTLCFEWSPILLAWESVFVVRNSVLGAPPDTKNQDVSKLIRSSHGSMKWLSAC